MPQPPITTINMSRSWALFAGALCLAGLILLWGHLRHTPHEAKHANPKNALSAEAITGLLPHHARYNIALKTVKSHSTIRNVSGTLDYEWKPDCSGVATSYHFEMLYDYGDGHVANVSSQIATYEQFEAPRIDFSLERSLDGELIEAFKGYANLEDGRATYTIPQGVTLDLPAGTLFPTPLLLRLIKGIETHEPFVQAPLFDGSDSEDLLLVNAFIGAPAVTLNEAEDALDPMALDSPAVHTRMAFFLSEDDGMRPDYEMSAIFHKNGVMRNINIEYDDFSITQDLVGLTPLEGACNN